MVADRITVSGTLKQHRWLVAQHRLGLIDKRTTEQDGVGAPRRLPTVTGGVELRACSAGFKPAGWLVFSLTKSLFMSCQNSIFLSQQSAGTVFFSPAEQAQNFCLV